MDAAHAGLESPSHPESADGFVGLFVHHPGSRPRFRLRTTRFTYTRRARATLDPYGHRRANRQHRARLRALIHDHTPGPAHRGQRWSIRVGSHRDQTDSPQHSDRFVPAQADHVRRRDLSGKEASRRNLASPQDPPPDRRLPTRRNRRPGSRHHPPSSSSRAAANAQRPPGTHALHQDRDPRRDRIERSAYHTLDRPHDWTIVTRQDIDDLVHRCRHLGCLPRRDDHPWARRRAQMASDTDPSTTRLATVEPEPSSDAEKGDRHNWADDLRDG